MKNSIFSLAALIILFSSINTLADSKIYYWVDADGNSHYADTATPGTEEIQVSNKNVISLSGTTEKTGSVAEAVKESIIKYRATITSPSDDSALRSNDGVINIQVETIPEKKSLHKLQLVLDGRPLGSPQISTTIRTSNIDRGTHQIQVQLLDEKGNILALTQVVTVHLQRMSVGSAS